jgi:hypothetical protein
MPEPLTLLGPAVNVINRIIGRRRPRLHIAARNTGGGSQVDFTALVSNIGTAPALGCVLTAELDDGIGVVYESGPFALAEGQVEHPVPFGLERPRYGNLVPALNNVFTLYGRQLTVTVRSGRARAVDVVEEELYNPATDRARHEAQQAAWETGRPLARPPA